MTALKGKALFFFISFQADYILKYPPTSYVMLWSILPVDIFPRQQMNEHYSTCLSSCSTNINLWVTSKEKTAMDSIALVRPSIKSIVIIITTQVHLQIAYVHTVREP